MPRIVPAAIAIALSVTGMTHAQSPAPPVTPGLTLTSPAFSDGGIIPDRFTQLSTAVLSPALVWSNVPDGVASFALIAHDLNAAPGKGTRDVLHWLIIDIPGGARGLPEGVAGTPRLPDGSVQGRNTGNTIGYRPPGARAPGPYHHYAFELYALDTKLGLGPDMTRDDVLKAMDGHVVAKAADVGLFHR